MKAKRLLLQHRDGSVPSFKQHYSLFSNIIPSFTFLSFSSNQLPLCPFLQFILEVPRLGGGEKNYFKLKKALDNLNTFLTKKTWGSVKNSLHIILLWELFSPTSSPFLLLKKKWVLAPYSFPPPSPLLSDTLYLLSKGTGNFEPFLYLACYLLERPFIRRLHKWYLKQYWCKTIF